MNAPVPLVLSCEHGGNRVPAAWADLFEGARADLGSHRGWDPGALPLARSLARRLGAPLVTTLVTRLLVEPNRSLGHPALFSVYTRTLPVAERERLLARYWRPHRARVEAAVRKALDRSPRVLHLGVHTFTPMLDGKPREVDVGLLYDPARVAERSFCARWAAALRRELPGLAVRANAPYRGASDGLTTHLRTVLGEGYLGVELEVNQRLLLGPPRARSPLYRALAGTLGTHVRSPQISGVTGP